jgi:hypothetical protein
MSRPSLEIADVFRGHGSAWRRANAGHVNLDHLKVSRPSRAAARRLSAGMSRAARSARTRTSPTTRAAIATARRAKAQRRDVYRWEHEEVTDRHRARMAQAEAIVRRRKALAEHPFGTLKCRTGYRHFLLRGFAKVRGEWGLMALCYNFTRVLTILGLDRFMAYLARRHSNSANFLLKAIIAVAGCLRTGMARIKAHIGRNTAAIPLGFIYAA